MASVPVILLGIQMEKKIAPSPPSFMRGISMLPLELRAPRSKSPSRNRCVVSSCVSTTIDEKCSWRAFSKVDPDGYIHVFAVLGPASKSAVPGGLQMSHSGVAPQKDDSRGTQHKKADADTKDSARKALQCKGDSHTQEHRCRIVVIIKSTFGWCNRPLQQVRRVEENNQAFGRNEKLPEALETVHQCHQAPPHDDRITEQIRQRALGRKV